jgi:hypothetical protein
VENKQRLILEAVSGVWVSVNADGQEVFSNVMNSGDKKLFEADKTFVLKIGYTPGLKVFFNGKQINTMEGAVNHVNKIVLKKPKDNTAAIKSKNDILLLT